MKGSKLYIKSQLYLDKLYSEHKILDLETKQKLYKEYLKIIRKLAYGGHLEAQYDLAQHYDDIGFWGVPNPYYNIYKKFHWYSKAAENSHAAACNSLANMYERGEGCTKDINKALELYKKSSDLGDVLGKKNYKLLLKQINQGYYKTKEIN